MFHKTNTIAPELINNPNREEFLHLLAMGDENAHRALFKRTQEVTDAVDNVVTMDVPFEILPKDSLSVNDKLNNSSNLENSVDSMQSSNKDGEKLDINLLLETLKSLFDAVSAVFEGIDNLPKSLKFVLLMVTLKFVFNPQISCDSQDVVSVYNTYLENSTSNTPKNPNIYLVNDNQFPNRYVYVLNQTYITNNYMLVDFGARHSLQVQVPYLYPDFEYASEFVDSYKDIIESRALNCVKHPEYVTVFNVDHLARVKADLLDGSKDVAVLGHNHECLFNK